MLPKIKNIIIFLSIAVAIVLIYLFVFKKSDEGANLQSTGATVPVVAEVASPVASSLDKDFLPLLLNVKNIKLEDSIFKDKAFISLVDSSIVLTPDGNEGRINPFAPFGYENTAEAISSLLNSQTANTNNANPLPNFTNPTIPSTPIIPTTPTTQPKAPTTPTTPKNPSTPPAPPKPPLP